jgi:hypothetical protein
MSLIPPTSSGFMPPPPPPGFIPPTSSGYMPPPPSTGFMPPPPPPGFIPPPTRLNMQFSLIDQNGVILNQQPTREKIEMDEMKKIIEMLSKMNSLITESNNDLSKLNLEFKESIDKLRVENERIKQENNYLRIRNTQLILEIEANKIDFSSLPSDEQLKAIWRK